MMRKALMNSAVALAAVLVLLGTGCDKLKSRDHINQGITAFKNAKYGDEISFTEDERKNFGGYLTNGNGK